MVTVGNAHLSSGQCGSVRPWNHAEIVLDLTGDQSVLDDTSNHVELCGDQPRANHVAH